MEGGWNLLQPSFHFLYKSAGQINTLRFEGNHPAFGRLAPEELADVCGTVEC